MEEGSSANCNISELILLLKQEGLLISSDKNEIKNLHEKLRCCIDELAQAAWINTRQRLNLHSLVSAKPDCSPSYCAHRASCLPRTIFVQAKEVLGYQASISFGSFLQELRNNPQRLAQWTALGESVLEMQWKFPSILHSFVTGLYGSCLLPEDTDCMLQFLKELAKLQIAKNENPQKMLKQRSCSFAKMYYLFHEEVPSAKHFLCALLQTPILQLISDTDCYLDIDSEETYSRYSANSSKKIYCNGNSERRYDEDMLLYRKWVVRKLVEWTNSVIASLQENSDCFPSSLAWLVRKIAEMLSVKYGENSKEVNSVISDLIFTRFICPAIINPEEYGIFDAPLLPSSRHNLIQVSKVLQMLAMIKFESPDPKLMDVYGSFDPDVIQNIVSSLLPDRKLIKETPPTEKIAAVQKDIVLFTEQELHNLVTFLQTVLQNMLQEQSPTVRSESLEQLSLLLSSLPSSSENSPSNSRQTFPLEGSPKRPNIFTKVAKSTLTRSLSASNTACADQDEFIAGPVTVLVIPIQREEEKPVGLLSEQKVLQMKSEISKELVNLPVSVPEVPVVIGESTQEKRTRFLISHDEGSIGNTSDNLEAISEAASNHSVASSLELENEDQNDNDNLSDMVSANVSGRGTPNISGRDTPSSQVNDNEERAMPEVRQQFLAQPQPLINKQIRSEIDDKFCKFEIKKLLQGDETISIISDTWSTDVLASDSETIDANDGRQEQIFAPIVDSAIQNPLLDISETHSESAWSTDVLTSDTERLTEVDNDDIASLARSDDASSVARSDDVTRSEGEENLGAEPDLPDRRLSNPSYQYVNNLDINYMEYRRVETVQRSNSGKSDNFTDTNANSILHNSFVYTAGRSSERSVNETIEQSVRMSTGRRSSDISQEMLRNGNIEGSNKLSQNAAVIPPSYVLLKNLGSKFEDASDIKSSNCSLNSSSSGSSRSSSSGENGKNMMNPNRNGEQWEGKQWLNSSENSLNVTSTPSESTSELSVLSANTLISPVNIPFLNKKEAALNARGMKPSTSTGAIPKSISFDMSAEKGDKDLDEDGKCKRGSFLGKLKMGFRNRRGKSFRDDYNNGRVDCDDDKLRAKRAEALSKASNAEISDNILAKYRAKSISEKVPNGLQRGLKDVDLPDAGLPSAHHMHVDSNSLFEDARKKLRYVLSNSHTLFISSKQNYRGNIKSNAESFLNQEIARARSLNQWSVAARASEALRCIRLLDSVICNKLFESLRKDYMQRSLYTQYLLHSRQILLSAQAYLDIIQEQIESDKILCENYLISTCVQLFLEKYDNEVHSFCEEFRQLSLADEKYDLLLNFLNHIFALMGRQSMWTEIHSKKAVIIAVERIIINKVYVHALFPNGDCDRDRDRVLSEHILKLSCVITPNHKDLMISKVFQLECPWLLAQQALKAMAAYRTPRDKISCVIRCATSIMNLLSLAQERGSTSADDFTPVLVYVIIMANPQDLLSTIEYVNSFYNNNQLQGEEQYWWTQFCAAVEYIKTMDYSD